MSSAQASPPRYVGSHQITHPREAGFFPSRTASDRPPDPTPGRCAHRRCPVPALGHRARTARHQPGVRAPLDLAGCPCRAINRLGVDTAYASAVCAYGRDGEYPGAATHDPAAHSARDEPVRVDPRVTDPELAAGTYRFEPPRRRSSPLPRPRFMLLLLFHPKPAHERSGGLCRDIDHLRRGCRWLPGPSPDRCRG